MSRFAENAAKIFEAAESASRSGHRLSAMTVLIGAGGGIRMIADSDWPLESLRSHHGAEMAFRVSEDQSGFAVEGRSGTRTWAMRGEKPSHSARQFLNAMGWRPAGALSQAPAEPEADRQRETGHSYRQNHHESAVYGRCVIEAPAQLLEAAAV